MKPKRTAFHHRTFEPSSPPTHRCSLSETERFCAGPKAYCANSPASIFRSFPPYRLYATFMSVICALVGLFGFGWDILMTLWLGTFWITFYFFLGLLKVSWVFFYLTFYLGLCWWCGRLRCFWCGCHLPMFYAWSVVVLPIVCGSATDSLWWLYRWPVVESPNPVVKLPITRGKTPNLEKKKVLG